MEGYVYMKAIALAVVLIAASAPAMAQSRACDRLHREYRDADGPKAWAEAPDGGCGYASGRSASSLSEARRRAYEYCAENSRGCRVTQEERR